MLLSASEYGKILFRNLSIWKTFAIFQKNTSNTKYFWTIIIYKKVLGKLFHFYKNIKKSISNRYTFWGTAFLFLHKHYFEFKYSSYEYNQKNKNISERIWYSSEVWLSHYAAMLLGSSRSAMWVTPAEQQTIIYTFRLRTHRRGISVFLYFVFFSYLFVVCSLCAMAPVFMYAMNDCQAFCCAMQWVTLV